MTSIKFNIIFIFFLVSVVPNNLLAQNRKLEKADKMYTNLAFADASTLYQEIVDKGNASTDVYTKLGDCYYFNANYSEAVKSYSMIMASGENVAPEYYFRYAQALNSLGNHTQASELMKKYYSKFNKKDLSTNWSSQKILGDIKLQSGRYTVLPVGINSPFSDFGTAFWGNDKIVFTSAKDTGIIVRRIHKWNNKSFLKLYEADLNNDGAILKSSIIKGDLNSKYHQSSPSITKDGKTMYFTRNNYIDGKLGIDKESGISYLKIYTAQYIDGVWKNIKELSAPVNGQNFSSAHPALSVDETELYFVSDRNNKFGNSDLYVIDIKNGIVGTNIKKLGDEINTLGAETFPFVDASGILYFASDGHPGLGGLDVFAASKDDKGLYQIINLGDGINTESDDFAYIIKSDTKKGFFSSNRSGNDDIYSFIENKPPIFNILEKSIDPTTVAVKEGDDLQETLQLEPIYFDFSDYKIKETSKQELNKIIQLMTSKPTVVVKVNSYADSRGRADFNLSLSDKRAKATVDYIRKGGIDSYRISGEGFGEKKIINKCVNGIKCTEEEHQINRRSEFIIVKK